MDAQTLAKTIKQRTKRGEWWTWAMLPRPKSYDAIRVLAASGWLERRTLGMNDPLRTVGTQFAYRWTKTHVGRVARV